MWHDTQSIVVVLKSNTEACILGHHGQFQGSPNESVVNRDMNSGWDLTSRVVLQPVTCLLYAMPSGLRTCGSQETTTRMAVRKVVRTGSSETRQS